MNGQVDSSLPNIPITRTTNLLPNPVIASLNATDIAIYQFGTFILDNSGRIWYWQGSVNQMLIQLSPPMVFSTPTIVATQLSSGSNNEFVCAVFSNGINNKVCFFFSRYILIHKKRWCAMLGKEPKLSTRPRHRGRFNWHGLF